MTSENLVCMDTYLDTYIWGTVVGVCMTLFVPVLGIAICFILLIWFLTIWGMKRGRIEY